MMHWDDSGAGYPLVKLRSFLRGQVVVGYPPSVGAVDVNLTRASILSDSHLIGRVSPSGGQPWTFAIEWSLYDQVIALPCERRLLLGAWMIDIETHGRLLDSPVDPLRGSLTGWDGAMYIWSLHEVVGFDRNGQRWRRGGLFDADLETVKEQGQELACQGYLHWIEPGWLFTLLLDASSGRISGGDPKAVAAHEATG